MVVLTLFFSTSVMAQYAYFYADQEKSAGTMSTDIFSVELTGSKALLQNVVSTNGLYQIAYNGSSNVLYLFNTNGSYFTSYDITNATFGPNVYLSPSLKQVEHAAFDDNGALLVYQDVGGSVYTVDAVTGAVTKPVVSNSGRNVGGNQLNNPRNINTQVNRLVGPATSFNGANNGQLTVNRHIGAPAAGGNILTYVDNSFEFILVDGTTGQPTGQTFATILNNDPFLLDSEGGLTGTSLAFNAPAPPPPPACEFDYYLSRNDIGSELYGVEFNGTDAELTLLETLNYPIHIAMDGDNNTLYLVSNSSSMPVTVQSYDPATGTFGPIVPLAIDHVTQAVYGNGTLYVGSVDDNTIYSVDYNTGIISPVGSVNVSGGDLIFDTNGDLLSVSGRTVTKVSLSGGSNSTFANLGSGNYCVGMGLLSTGNIVVASYQNDQLMELDATGNIVGAFDLKLNGNTFVQNNGDIAAACAVTPPTPICPDFSTYYLSFSTSRIDTTKIFGVSLTGGNAELTLITSLPGHKLHGAFNEADGYIYTISQTDARLRAFDPATGTLVSDIATTSIPTGSIVGVAYKDPSTLVIAHPDAQKLYYLDINTGVATFFANAPVRGGDVFYDTAGNLFLAAKDAPGSTTGKIYSVSPSGIVTALYPVPAMNGATLSAYGNVLISPTYTSTYQEYDAAGNLVATYPAMLNGASFDLVNGDMASGCYSEPVQPVTPGTTCEFAYYLSKNIDQTSGTVSELYGVELNGSDADVTLLENFNYPIHIAMDGDNELLYLVSNTSPVTVQSYEPATGTFGPLVNLAITDVPQTAFGNGALYIASSSDDVVYTVDYPAGTLTAVGSVNVAGGDLAFDANGDLLSVNSRMITKVSLTGGSNSTYANLGTGNSVAGLALTPSGDLLVSDQSEDELNVYDNTGTLQATYSLKLNGATFTQLNGDLASACVALPEPPASCEFAYYLSRNIDQTGGTVSELYGVELNGTDADLTLLENFPYSIHIALDENGLIYIAGNGGSSATVQTYDPADGTFGPLVALPISNLPQAVYGNGTLYVGSGADNNIYAVDYPAGTVTAVSSSSAGTGDLVFTASGELWSVGSYNTITEISLTGGSNSTVGSVSGPTVVGFALTDADEILVSQNGSSQLKVLDGTGSATGTTYNLKLNGATFTQQKGDLASACVIETPEPTCDQVYFLSRNAGGSSEVYGVELNGTDAELTLLSTFNAPVHLAFNSNASELYIVANTNPATITTYNTLSATSSAPVSVAGINGVVQMVYDDANDLLYIGSQSGNAIYTVDPTTGASTFVANADVDGGDLVLTSSGALLNTSNGTNEFATISGGTSTPLAPFSGTLVGLASTPDSLILAAFQSSTTLTVFDESGVATGGAYNLVLNGASFTQGSGDLAGGCGSFVAPTNKKGANDEAASTLTPETFAEMSIYPNPATDRVTVEFTAASESNTVDVMIFNTMGQQVHSSNHIGSVKTGVDVSALQTGMYMVIVKENGVAAHTSKLIVR